ncbi:hypothetical protein HY622_03600 [Candidatus Uhrbacteria bacterium]|nr:hypothetical protein [Candidatus Uhrbacteria bacterium]
MEFTQMSEHGYYDRESNTREKPRAVPYGVLSFAIFLAGLAFVFGIVIILNNIKEPFRFDASSQGYVAADIESGEPSIALLKSSDTDGDGLTDYDELYTYRTSPYLKDTDSDGYTDDEELKTGHDPNCASGKSCFGSAFSVSTSTPATASANAMPESLKTIFGPQGPRSIEDFASLSIDQVRELLASQGVSKEDLAKIDDKALMEVYQKTYKDFSEKALSDKPLAIPSSDAQTQAQNSTLQIDPERLKNPESFTPEEIRNIIRSSGSLTEEQLKTIDDKTLKDVFMQTVKDYKP